VVVDIKQHKSQFNNLNFTITQSAKFFWHCGFSYWKGWSPSQQCCATAQPV